MTKKTSTPTDTKLTQLIIEPHPKNYAGPPFVTLVQYRGQSMLTLVDNVDEENLKAFVLDLCGPEKVDEEAVIQAALDWYSTNRTKYPISVEFSRRGLAAHTSKIYRTLNVEFISRVIGPINRFPMDAVKSVRRRRRRPISPMSLPVAPVQQFAQQGE